MPAGIKFADMLASPRAFPAWTRPRLARVGALTGGLVVLLAIRGGWHTPEVGLSSTAPQHIMARPLPSDEEATAAAIRFLEHRARLDPEDFSTQNQLAGYYLLRLRETSDVVFLHLATRAARASLASVPAARNLGGVSALAQAEFAAHEFAQARDHARQLTQLDPARSERYALLGDTLLELGEYEQAADAFREMERLGSGTPGAEIRLGRVAVLYGHIDEAQRHFSTALALSLDAPVPPRETVAWCRWQLGETAFSIGQYDLAEQHYRDALVTFPGYLQALPSLGRVRAARGDLAGAIEQYELALQRVPDPVSAAALVDLYRLTGQGEKADARYALVEQIGRLNRVNGAAPLRPLTLFRADHHRDVSAAYEDAAQEYRTRRDIYGADALAWAALNAGKAGEAQQAIHAALRLGTKDARLWYHAGIIARGAGDDASARRYLEQALELNPQFDPWHAREAHNALLSLSGGSLRHSE